MRAEAFVLIGQQHGDKSQIDIVHARRQPPAAFRRRKGTQQSAFAIGHRDYAVLRNFYRASDGPIDNSGDIGRSQLREHR